MVASVVAGRDEGARGSAVFDFVLTSFALLAFFGSAMAVVTNLYLRAVLTNAATEGARLLARADVSSGCGSRRFAAEALAIERAKGASYALIGSKIDTSVTAHTTELDGLCTAVVTVAATLPGLPMLASITNFEATAHATLELQQ